MLLLFSQFPTLVKKDLLLDVYLESRNHYLGCKEAAKVSLNSEMNFVVGWDVSGSAIVNQTKPNQYRVVQHSPITESALILPIWIDSLFKKADGKPHKTTAHIPKQKLTLAAT